MNRWLFKDGPETTAVTSEEIAGRSVQISYVSHEVDEEGEIIWQFLHGENYFDFSTALIVRLDTILKIDGTIAELAELPIGYSATRKDIGDPWTIQPIVASGA